ncbi:uncharacterized protein LOC134561940 [Prinia subflava]|uniref:uncharacterized protein LOC134561940 n=1 Tax=Prinia subflava TaxID=208062 RepID=UPI002FE18CD6
MPERTLTINTLLALIRGTKAPEKEVGKRTLMKIFAAQTQESAELPPVCPAFPRTAVGRTMGCPSLASFPCWDAPRFASQSSSARARLGSTPATQPSLIQPRLLHPPRSVCTTEFLKSLCVHCPDVAVLYWQLFLQGFLALPQKAMGEPAVLSPDPALFCPCVQQQMQKREHQQALTSLRRLQGELRALAGPKGDPGELERNWGQGMEGQYKGEWLPLPEGRDRWDIGKDFFPVRVGRPWHRVPRAAVAAPGSLAVSKAMSGSSRLLRKVFLQQRLPCSEPGRRKKGFFFCLQRGGYSTFSWRRLMLSLRNNQPIPPDLVGNCIISLTIHLSQRPEQGLL